MVVQQYLKTPGAGRCAAGIGARRRVTEFGAAAGVSRALGVFELNLVYSH